MDFHFLQHGLIGLGKKLISLIFKFFRFTGLWTIIVLVVLSEKVQLTKAIWVIPTLVLFLAPVYITINNVIRLLKKDAAFSLIKSGINAINNSEKKETLGTGHKGYGVLKPEGFIFGKKGLNYISKPELTDGHIAVLGGAGSGKSSAIAIPSLISWNAPIFAIDIKGELSSKTINHRKAKGRNIRVFNPTDRDSFGFNPFWILDNSTNKVQDIKEIVNAIVPTNPEDKDPFWTESSQNVLSSALLTGYENGETFVEVIEKIASNSLPVLFEWIKEKGSSQANMFISQLADMKIETIASVGQNLSNRILVFATDSDIISALSKHDVITPEDLERGFDIYLQLPEDKLDQWQGLMTLLVNTFLKAFERREENNDNPILFALDEFPRLGKVQTITNGLATLRSKKITIALFMQSMAQLDLIYGKETRQVIFDNCQYKAILRATDQETQEYLSKLVGTYDKSKTSTSANYGAYLNENKGTGTSSTTEERRIIKPEEFGTLEDVVLLTPHGFSRIEKASYWKDKNFK